MCLWTWFYYNIEKMFGARGKTYESFFIYKGNGLKIILIGEFGIVLQKKPILKPR